MTRFLLINFFLIASLYVNSQNKFKQIVFDAKKTSIKYLDSVFGKNAVNKAIIFNENESIVTNEYLHKSGSMNVYLGDYEPLQMIFSYIFRYKGDTIHGIAITVNDSLKVIKNDNYEQMGFMDALAWRYAMLGKFKFNYDDLKQFINDNKSIDTTFYETGLSYDYLPNKIVRDNRTFVEISFFWSIFIYSRTRHSRDDYDTSVLKREIKIDASTGRMIEDKLITPISRE